MLAIPPAILDLLDLSPGGKVGLAVDNGRLVVEPQAKPHSRPHYTLDELLGECDASADLTADDNEWLAGKPVGGELL